MDKENMVYTHHTQTTFAGKWMDHAEQNKPSSKSQILHILSHLLNLDPK
jgi:hypothetical protein